MNIYYYFYYLFLYIFQTKLFEFYIKNFCSLMHIINYKNVFILITHRNYKQ